MHEQRAAQKGWFARWREHRRVKRQQASERAYLAQEHARSYGGARASSATDRWNASGYASSYGTTSSGFWGGFGGDCGGGDGGGGC
jgi:hypothetical protein